ncbi:MAG: hypothetical protein MI807_21030 [Verrucomicrobiales bacterium]|nr:hypothetical protein [Verrucomicrobiales bacterium]
MKIVPPHLNEVLSIWEEFRQAIARWEEDAMELQERIRNPDSSPSYIQEGLFRDTDGDPITGADLPELIPAKPFEEILTTYCTGKLADYGGHATSYPPRWELERESVVQVTFKSDRKVTIQTKYRDEVYGQIREYVFKPTDDGWKLAEFLTSTPPRAEDLAF